MARPVFLDVDNTLLDNDAAKAALASRIAMVVPADGARRFWQLYETVRADVRFRVIRREPVEANAAGERQPLRPMRLSVPGGNEPYVLIYPARSMHG